ncbi:SDR family NAD(P)-dependent oxidoreductase [Marinobacter halodurans]|uniref:SDR family NAD(P)-dependent oxidoreductase n=1 Tax=Marinobacter halodurans TaxID=2528979 RepID=A0ABY1ZJD6_9GAMM|nr:SDR family NAD(P)-dependent oxidoreductase [Marinobacter halodurans]TBW54879.1 SDR family NAD(P)-dependent oxidoreductase [Marinobacter halodurans]
MTLPAAVVTGAGRRLGYELSKALLTRDYQVFALYRTPTDDVDRLREDGASMIQVDLADRHSVHQAIERIRHTMPLRVLINNASQFEENPEDADALADLAERLYRVNTLAPMQLIEGLADTMKASGSERAPLPVVINITDIFAENPNPRYAAYCATKAALANLTLSYAKSLAPAVRVNAIMPGPIRFLPRHTDDEKQEVLAETLLAREGGFESVVKQALALIDNDFMTGAMIPVDGGRRLA